MDVNTFSDTILWRHTSALRLYKQLVFYANTWYDTVMPKDSFSFGILPVSPF